MKMRTNFCDMNEVVSVTTNPKFQFLVSLLSFVLSRMRQRAKQRLEVREKKEKESRRRCFQVKEYSEMYSGQN
jgi:hypothetical protein